MIYSWSNHYFKSIKHKYLLIVMVAIFLAIHSGCGTLPPREVHSGISLPRTISYDTSPLGKSPQRFSVGFDIGRGAGSTDSGVVRGSTHFNVFGEARPFAPLTLGANLFWGYVDGKLDSNSNFGFRVYTRWRFAETHRWVFSLIPAYSLSQNKTVEHGAYCAFFICSATSDTSSGEISANEGQLGLIAAHYFNDQNFMAIAPSIYLTRLRATYSVSNKTIYSESRNNLNSAFLLGYGHHFGEESESRSGDTLFHISAGFATFRGLGGSENSARIEPLVQLGLQFGLGDRIAGIKMRKAGTQEDESPQ